MPTSTLLELVGKPVIEGEAVDLKAISSAIFLKHDNRCLRSRW
jgi:hypothetical protein